jgi:glycosyltransferase involved in cell wall biosynthesis
MTKILIVGSDAIGKNMAGPGIRSYEIARILSKKHEVVIAVQSVDDIKPFGPEIILKDHDLLARYIKKCDVVMVQGFLLEQYPILKHVRVPLVVDLYDPFIFEGLQLDKKLPMTGRTKRHNFNLKMFADQLLNGDFFITANEEQRDYWIGMLAVYNRINPWTYEADKTLYNLIDVVPFGIPQEKPVHRKRVLKGVFPGINENDKIILWGGGIWNWFDPMTLVKTMKMIAQERDDIKVFFMGTKRPDAPEDIADESSHFRKMEQDAKQYCASENLLDSFVFFNEWVPFFERENYLLESDIGISLHLETIEAEFANRTRILDYIWTSLPIITTKGDPLSKLVDEKELGIAVNPKEPEELKEAIYKLIDNNEIKGRIKENLERIAPEFYWDKVTIPLQKYCDGPKYAVDKPERKSGKITKIEKNLVLKSSANEHVHKTLEDEFKKTANEISIVMEDYYKTNKELVLKIADLEKSLRSLETKLRAYEIIIPVRLLKRIKNFVVQFLTRKTRFSEKAVFGEICGNMILQQEFLCIEDRLMGIAVQFATYNRINDRDIFFKLYDAEGFESEILNLKVNARDLSDNQYHDFIFKPLVNSKNRRFYFQIFSLDSFPGNAVTVWIKPQREDETSMLFVNKKKVKSEIFFNTLFES